MRIFDIWMYYMDCYLEELILFSIGLLCVLIGHCGPFPSLSSSTLFLGCGFCPTRNWYDLYIVTMENNMMLWISMVSMALLYPYIWVDMLCWLPLLFPVFIVSLIISSRIILRLHYLFCWILHLLSCPFPICFWLKKKFIKTKGLCVFHFPYFPDIGMSCATYKWH